MINVELRKTGKEIQKRSDKDDPKKALQVVLSRASAQRLSPEFLSSIFIPSQYST
jgi:hypothetical protein